MNTIRTIMLWMAVAFTLQAQPSDTTFTPRIYAFDTRTTAMGDATVADPHSLSAISVNPASLSFVRNLRSFSLYAVQNVNNNRMTEIVTFPGIGNGSQRIAFQLGIQHGGTNASNYFGAGTYPEPTLTAYSANMAYAVSFANVLSLGILNNVTFARNNDAQYWTYSADLGLLYAPSESVRYGMAFRGLGRSVTYDIIEDDRTTLGSEKGRNALELGATLTFPTNTDRTYFSLSLANEKRFGEDGIWYKGGLELKPVQALSLRSGFVFHPENNVYIPRLGIGFNQNRFALDYAVSLSKELNERFHQIGILIEI